MYPAGRRDPRHREDLRHVDRVLVRLAAALSLAAAVSFLLAGLITGDERFLWGIIGPLIVAVLAGVQIAQRHERVGVILLVAAAVTVVQNRLLGIEDLARASVIALAIIGMAGALFIRRHTMVYIAGYGAFIFITRMWWAGDGSATRLVESVIVTISVVFGAAVMAWLSRQLEISAQRYRNLFDNAPVTLWEEDFSRVGAYLDDLRADGVVDLGAYLDAHPQAVRRAAELITITDVNEAAVQLLEAPDRESLMGHLTPKTPAALDALKVQLEAVWHGRRHVVAAMEGAATAQGTRIESLLYWSAPLVDGKIDLSRVTVAIIDMTKQRETERQLQDLLRSKDEFVATVSHELRTPLTTVVGLSEELRDGYAAFPVEERKELVDLIASQSQEVAKIVDDLLVAARSESGNVSVVLEPADLVEQVSEVLAAQGVEDSAPLQVSGVVPAAMCDASRIRQIVRNLVVNAQRYGGLEIRVVIRSDRETVYIEVRDDGSPLPDSIRNAIFEPYFRSRQMRGLTASVGLGLTVSRELARLMGGDLSYDHDGDESVFTLQLPVAVATSAAEEAAGSASVY